VTTTLSGETFGLSPGKDGRNRDESRVAKEKFMVLSIIRCLARWDRDLWRNSQLPAEVGIRLPARLSKRVKKVVFQ